MSQDSDSPVTVDAHTSASPSPGLQIPPDAKRPASFAAYMIRLWLSRMSTATTLEFVEGIRQLEGISPVPRWGLFGGCCISSVFFRHLSPILKELYSIDIDFTTELVAEIDTERQAFICAQTPPEWLVGDVKQLDSESGFNLMATSKRPTLYPSTHMMDAGVPCVSVTPLSSAKVKNKGCVQKETASTGQGFKNTFAIVRRHKPKIITFECVQMTTTQTESGVSDQAWITEEMKAGADGGWSHCESLDAHDFGSYASRVRPYWVTIPDIKSTDMYNEVTVYFRRLLNSFKIPEPLDWVS